MLISISSGLVLSSSWFHSLGGPQKAADLLQWIDVKELRLSFVRALSLAHVDPGTVT